MIELFFVDVQAHNFFKFAVMAQPGTAAVSKTVFLTDFPVQIRVTAFYCFFFINKKNIKDTLGI